MAGKLTIPQQRVLSSVRHRAREARWDHATFNKLWHLKLVSCEAMYRTNGRLSSNKRWTITPAGIEALS